MICTAASDGVCTTCKADNQYIFQNKAATPEKGRECILCSDATQRDGVTGVKDCLKCTAPSGNAGAATCTECQDGYYMDSQACSKCDQSCLTCDGSGQNACTSCPEGKLLRDNACVNNNGCTGNTYADPESGKCLPCNTIDQGCTQCEVDSTTKKPKCTNCGSQKMVKTELDGTTTCVDANGCAQDSVEGTHFLSNGDTKCIPCDDASDTTSGNTGVLGCKTCTKTESDNPTCSECLAGYYNSASGNTATCVACGGQNCATCAKATSDKCTTCKQGYFLKDSSSGECVPCSDTNNGGIDGCVDTL